MKASLKKRVWLSFLTLVLLFIVNGLITISAVHNIQKLSHRISTSVDPAETLLHSFKSLLIESKMYATNWVFLRSNDEDKKALKKMHSEDYPKLKSALNNLLPELNNDTITNGLKNIFSEFESLIKVEEDIMQQLDEFSDYDDPVKKIMAEQTIEYEIIPRTAKILKELETVSLIAHNIEVASDSRREKSSDNLTFFIIALSISVIIIGIVLSALFSRSITNPINQIEAIIWDLGKGLANKVTYKGADEEIDQMIQSVNNLSDKIQETAAFAVAIGNRNYTVPYLPLSDGDKLGKALLTMRDNIRTSEEELLKTTSSLIQRNKALEQYTFIVSHNLRAPVATIIGLAELLPADQVEDKDASVILQGVKEAAQKLDRVIHDLNRILEVRQQVYEGSEKVSLSRIAEDTKQLFQNIIQQEGIILEWDFSQIDTINSVKSYIESIFYNIISNSIKYRRADVVLKIDIQSQLKKDKIILSFTDNGKGIDTEKNSEKLFRLYERFDTSIEGKGMGMYMMKAQVDSLNGNIAVQSALDKGTQITIELPLT